MMTTRKTETRRGTDAETRRRGYTVTRRAAGMVTQRRVDATAMRRDNDFPLGWMILWLLLALAFWPSLSKAQTPTEALTIAASPSRRVAASPAVERVATIGMTVSDMDRSVEFYAKVLSFEKVSDVEVAGEEYEHLSGVFGLRVRVVRMKLGGELIELTEYLAPKGRPVPVDSRSNDRWFQHIAIITSDMERAYARLRQYRVEYASSGPQRLPDWNKNAGGIRAFYFKDADGHVLEILQFPEGKGDPKWRQLRATSPGKLFLGIDHTAIVVSDTEASLKFYRDVLGFKIAGESENYGTEQEHLNNVFGARLRITSLRAAGGGPGIEFLEYLAPRTGRPFPADERANDLFHWQTTLFVRNAKEVFRNLLGNKYAFVSPGVVLLGTGDLGFTKGLTVRDPDGHVMQLVER
jgi:catechol 2,3-dioxygenase-like lactoylglutathione lyase family enzyme